MTSQRTRDRMVARLREQGIADETVLAAMAAVPRHAFVEEALASRAYEDDALPIGFEQTISQPVHGRADARGGARRARARARARGRHRVRLPGGGARAHRGRGVLDRAHRRRSPRRRARTCGRCGSRTCAWCTATAIAGCPRRRRSTRSSSPRRRPRCRGRCSISSRAAGVWSFRSATDEQQLRVFERTAGGVKERRLDPREFVPMRVGKG